jgi:hypothetical protein
MIKFGSTSRRSSPKTHVTSTGQTQSAEQVHEHQNDQDQTKDPDASACSPSLIAVIATPAAEREQQDNNQHDQ